MLVHFTPSRLRANLYRILDRVLETGVPVEIRRKGRCLWIVPERSEKLNLLKPHPDFIRGDREELIHLDWSDQWRP